MAEAAEQLEDESDGEPSDDYKKGEHYLVIAYPKGDPGRDDAAREAMYQAVFGSGGDFTSLPRSGKLGGGWGTYSVARFSFEQANTVLTSLAPVIAGAETKVRTN